MHHEKSNIWNALSQPEEKLAIQIGEIPVFCEDILISTLYVGSHAVHTCIQTDVYTIKDKLKEADFSKKGGRIQAIKDSVRKKDRNGSNISPKLARPTNSKNSYEQKHLPLEEPIYENQQPQITYPSYKSPTLHMRKEHTPNRSPPTPRYICPHKLEVSPMASSSDEAFIAQFAALNANHTHKSQLLLLKSATNASNIDHCALVRIITEKVIIEGQFATTMKRAWAIQSRTTFSMIDRNICLVEFVSEQELLRVTQKGVWSYRGDVVAMRRATDQADLINPKVSHIEVWTQMHRVPHQVVSKEGITTIAKSIAKPLSQVSECFTGGHKYHKVKLLLPLEHAILDTKQVQHHSLGSFPVLLVYKRLSKVCLFCSKIRHENQECQDKARMERISLDP